MTAQATGGYRCLVCGMLFNSLSDLDTHTREKHKNLQQLRDNKNPSYIFYFIKRRRYFSNITYIVHYNTTYRKLGKFQINTRK